ncbi:MAG TPA: YggT family protein [Actinomycetota bacterium]|nr:YggT family protein [Actinomycetota bacterium]
MFRPDWRPPSFLMPVLDVVYALTEPPLQLLRRVIPQPMGMPLDLPFLVLFLLVGQVLPRIICV